MGHAFLSDPWFDAVSEIFADLSPPVPDAIQDIVINFRIQDGPDGVVETRMQGGRLHKGFGEGAPTTLNMPYDVAYKMMIENDQNAAMQAFMGGQIVVEGDMSKVMAMQSAGPPSTESQEASKRIQEMTG